MKNRDLRISDISRKTMAYSAPVFETDKRAAAFYRQAQEVADIYNKNHQEQLSAARLNTCAVLHLIYQTVITAYLKGTASDPFGRIAMLALKNADCAAVLDYYCSMFPSALETDALESDTLKSDTLESDAADTEEAVRAFFVHQVFQANPALLSASQELLSQKGMNFPDGEKALRAMLGSYLQGSGINDSGEEDLFSFLTYPARLFPDSLRDQITYIIKHWKDYLPEDLLNMLLRSIDYMAEEDHPHGQGGPGEFSVPNYSTESDYESFTEDRSWMPNVVMMAKSTLVWLDQLSRKYRRDIRTLDAIPDEELDFLKDSGFTALWLIGLWERSPASKTIKQLCGNPDAESSAYSLKSYSISTRLGGWAALENLRERCRLRGIRLASDMVPNHTGIDSDWIFSHGDYFMQQDFPPFPSYSYTGPDLSPNPDFEIKIEDHYYNRTDAAVTFMKRDRRTGQTSYIFHGNDGTSMPWNDTAQLDFLNPATREAVIRQILEIASNFPIIRFDAAMTLAKRHIQRLWYPKPGTGGDVAGRAANGMSEEEFNRRIPVEFWREVVDRIQAELPDTLLLAEAFWMMESYFVRTLGMHRVYNSAFMHMMKNEDNKKYRDSLKATLAFDPEILKRYVNFMNNPDEDTAISQFGDGDKYFGVCTLLATMPGLPMFGHGQIEGFREKYGMEYQRAYWDETPSESLIRRHREQIFPLLKMRHLFSGSKNFRLFDVIGSGGVEESVYAYTNGDDSRMALVLYNNRFEHVSGVIKESVPRQNKQTKTLETESLAQSLRLGMGGRRFVIYRDFSNGLFYILPSMKLFEDGLEVDLNGYQSKVLVFIHEIEDIDGIYEQLCRRLGGHGTADIDREIRIMYLEPFFNTARGLKDPKFLKSLHSILAGRSSAAARHEVMQTLGTFYTYTDELDGLFGKLGLEAHTLKPAAILKTVQNMERVSKKRIFADGNLIMGEDLANTAAAYFMLLPFLKDGASEEEALALSKALMLDRFFETEPALAGRCALLTDMGKSIRQLLESPAFLELSGCNEYQGVQWYRGEYFQECMYLACFSKALYTDKITAETEKAFEKEIQFWLRKHISAGYRLKGLKD